MHIYCAVFLFSIRQSKGLCYKIQKLVPSLGVLLRDLHERLNKKQLHFWKKSERRGSSKSSKFPSTISRESIAACPEISLFFHFPVSLLLMWRASAGHTIFLPAIIFIFYIMQICVDIIAIAKLWVIEHL